LDDIVQLNFEIDCKNSSGGEGKKESIDNEFVWEHHTASNLFAGKRIVIFGVPAAFSPVCTDHHLPDYERYHDDILCEGVDEVWCTSVNDHFVMFQWAKNLDVKKVRMLPDGNGDLARAMGMLVCSGSKGYGFRSWRYAMVVNDLRIEAIFEEPGKMDHCPVDPFTVSSVEQGVLPYLKREKKRNKHQLQRRHKSTTDHTTTTTPMLTKNATGVFSSELGN
jgi:peroxiredoxin